VGQAAWWISATADDGDDDDDDDGSSHHNPGTQHGYMNLGPFSHPSFRTSCFRPEHDGSRVHVREHRHSPPTNWSRHTHTHTFGDG